MLSDYIGIIGAVAGSVSTFLVMEGVHRLGGIRIFLREVRIKYHMNSSFKNSMYEEVKQPFRLGYDLEVYNSGNIPNILHDFSLVFYKGNSVVLEDRPKCDRNVFNVNPRQIIDISQVFDMDDLDDTLVGTTKIVLKYRTLKRRYRKFVLYEGQPIFPDTGK
ncbi:hypothetical protein [Anaerotignum sp. MB30-C6]|uniref:hypothetical protein n=1 Tax=Anaerotignum sp. MB30-C6 TaxID=3070814 RepID=UPI0027DE3E82|nr:hypothetical protein [Anaerotignum sp. MB30-C6]WMI82187.1 hypothetical protein RBQ60_05480 [Anaerotignum sp. MB30-C6]